MMAKNYSISFVISCILSATFAQELYSFRENNEMLQVFYEDGENGNWYYVRMSSFDYREGMIACRNLSDEAMLEYREMYVDNSDDEYGEIYMNCDDLPKKTSDCGFFVNTGGSAIGLTCMETVNHSVGDVRQLEDGRIIQLREMENGERIWTHFCFDDNENWDEHTANLACKSLGYDEVNPEGIAIEVESTMVYGVIEIECPTIGSFSDCNSTTSNNNGRCNDRRGNDSVIAIKCRNFPTNTPAQNNTVISRNVSSTTTSHSCVHTTYSLEKDIFDHYMVHIIVGGFAAIVILVCCVIGICSTVWVMVYCIRKKYIYSMKSPIHILHELAERKIDSRRSTLSKPGEEPYIPMKSILNGTIGEQLEKDKHYTSWRTCLNHRNTTNKTIWITKRGMASMMTSLSPTIPTLGIPSLLDHREENRNYLNNNIKYFVFILFNLYAV